MPESMNEFQRIDQEDKKALGQFLTLPLVLGSLLLITGAVGIYLTRYSNFQLLKLNNTALGPTLAFSEIEANLNALSQNVLRIGVSNLPTQDRVSLLAKSRAIIKKIENQVQVQVEFSREQAYEAYLNKWVTDWEEFRAQIEPKLTAYERVKNNLMQIDQSITSLIDKIENVAAFIQIDVKDMLESDLSFSRKATFALSIVLLAGFLIGLISSVIIVRNARKLFLLVTEGKQNRETLLNNLDEGLLVFDRSGQVQEGVSKSIKQFLGVDPTGRVFHEILPIGTKEKEKVQGWEKLIFSGTLRFSDFKPLAPQSFEKDGKYIQLDFKPIYAGSSDTIEKVICIASDKTVERKLREKADSETSLAKFVMTILSDRSSFVDYVLETRNILRHLRSELNRPDPSIETLFRGVHSLKGGAAAFHLTDLSREANDLEEMLAMTRAQGDPPMQELLPHLKIKRDEFERNFEAFLITHEPIFGKISNQEDRMKSISITSIYEIYQLILNQVGKESPIFTQFVETFVQEDLGSAFKRYESVVSAVAEKQRKRVTIHIEYGKVKVLIEPYLSLISCFIHVFRNAVDHGIEDELARVSVGKPITGIIDVQFHKVSDIRGNNRLRILVQDDGRGIDPSVIRAKAVEKEIISQDAAKTLSDEQAYQLLFHSGFSMRNQVSDISGRGVGLDAIQYEAAKLGGSAWLESKQGKGTCLWVEVPLYDLPHLAIHETKARRQAAA